MKKNRAMSAQIDQLAEYENMERPSGEDATRPSLLVRLRDHSDAAAWRTFASRTPP